jgi:hypothetical protein
MEENTMTRKDYELITSVLTRCVDNETVATPIVVARVFAKALAQDNKAFDKELFYKNCGVK